MGPTSSQTERVVHWFRNDLRLRDNRALEVAAGRAGELLLLFVLDEQLLADRVCGAARAHFLLGCLERLGASLARRGQRLLVRRGDPRVVVPALLRESRAARITWNADTTPYARARDRAVRHAAEALGVAVDERTDRVVFSSDELRTRSGGVYQVYTPFRNAWWQRLREAAPETGSPLRLPPPPARPAAGALPSAGALGATDATALPTPGEAAALRRLKAFLADPVARYAQDRDRPDRDGTSRLSPYLRFGVVSVRHCVRAALERAGEARARAGAHKWIDELVWRDFYAAILAEHPHVLRRSFKPAFDAVRWNDDETGFEAWCEGRTGYPFVDAAMRQLRATAWVHNRARMIAASFLTKDLLVDWRRGERFFFQHLVDGDPASNNGGWQWAASTGTDAQPWFRIFHPVKQGERFDPDGTYVRRFVPELRDVDARFVQRPWDAPEPPRDYPAPIVDHAERRILALRRFEAVRDPQAGGDRRAGANGRQHGKARSAGRRGGRQRELF